MSANGAPLGVVLVAYNAADVILDCLESLLASEGVTLRVVIVDNGSSDGTSETIRNWASGASSYTPDPDMPFDLTPGPKPLDLLDDITRAEGTAHAVALVETGENTGFAGGVNRGLAALAACSDVDRFWVLNPDSAVPPGTARAFATQAVPKGGFSLMGGRALYFDRPDMIQIDGGTVTWWSGITNNVNLFASHAATPPPDPAAMDFITGASMVASRDFYERVGPMREDYFLYYEEVDWALRRGDLPLAYCPDGIVYHRAGSAIGSAAHNRPASPFALYFKNRARMMFLRRFRPASVTSAQLWSLAKAGQYRVKGFHEEAAALLSGAFGRPIPQAVRARLSAEALARIEGISRRDAA